MPKKRKVARPTLKTIESALCLGLLVVFAIVVLRLVRTPPMRYARNPENVFDDSLAAANDPPVSRIPTRIRRTKAAELNKPLQLYNTIECACGLAVRCWNRARGGLPSGAISPAVAAIALANFGDRFARLEDANGAIIWLETCAGDMRAAARAPGREAFNLGALCSAVVNLDSALQAQSNACRDVLLAERQFLACAVARDQGGVKSAADALDAGDARWDEQWTELGRAARSMRAAADSLFD